MSPFGTPTWNPAGLDCSLTVMQASRQLQRHGCMQMDMATGSSAGQQQAPDLHSGPSALRKRTRAETSGAVPPQAPPMQRLAVEHAAPKPIRNLGNTCYMTVVMQALFTCSHIRNFFLSGVVPEPPPMEDDPADTDAALSVLQALVCLDVSWRRYLFSKLRARCIVRQQVPLRAK